MKTVESYFIVPSAEQLEKDSPKGTYQVVSCTEPKDARINEIAIQAGLAQQQFMTVTLRKDTKGNKYLIGNTKPINKTVFSKTNKIAFDIILEAIADKVHLGMVKFENCRLVHMESRVPYYPTRVNDEGERVRLTYPTTVEGQHEAGEEIKTRNHTFFLFEDDSLPVVLARQLQQTDWIEDEADASIVPIVAD